MSLLSSGCTSGVPSLLENCSILIRLIACDVDSETSESVFAEASERKYLSLPDDELANEEGPACSPCPGAAALLCSPHQRVSLVDCLHLGMALISEFASVTSRIGVYPGQALKGTGMGTPSNLDLTTASEDCFEVPAAGA